VLGDQLALFALLFRAKHDIGHMGVALVILAGTVPLVVLAPWAGHLVDSVRTRPILVSTLLCQLGLCVALVFTTRYWSLGCIAMLAAGTAVLNPAWSALVPSLVEPEQLPAASGLQQAWSTVAQIAGPFVGGLLVQVSGFRTPLVIDAVSFLALVSLVIVLRLDRAPVPRDGEESRGDAFAGMVLLWRDHFLRALMITLCAFVLAISLINVVDLFFITDTLHSSPGLFGLAGALFGLGMLATSVTVTHQLRLEKRHERWTIIGCALLSLGVIIEACSTSILQAVIGFFIAGLGNGLANVHVGVLMVRHVDEGVRGRAIAAVGAAISAASVVGMVAGGAAATAFDPRAILLVGGVGSALFLAITARPVLHHRGVAPEVGVG
jgi:MFS family permease